MRAATPISERRACSLLGLARSVLHYRPRVSDDGLQQRLIDLAVTINHVSEHSAAALVAECFESEPFEALAIIRSLKRNGPDSQRGN